MKNVIDTKTFETMFADELRVLINWPRFKAERWPVQLRHIDDRKALGNLLLPWAIDAKGGERTACNARGAKRITVAKGASRLSLAMSHRDFILDRAQDFSGHKGRSLVELVVAKCGRSSLLLDGCHRALALYIADVEFRATVFELHAPQDGAAVWDFVLANPV